MKYIFTTKSFNLVAIFFLSVLYKMTTDWIAFYFNSRKNTLEKLCWNCCYYICCFGGQRSRFGQINCFGKCCGEAKTSYCSFVQLIEFIPTMAKVSEMSYVQATMTRKRLPFVSWNFSMGMTAIFHHMSDALSN